ncbi:hypothetical protein EMA8858_02825 [Emticicia aquatica]|jgi:hypothetical protein|uniref:NirD/YgiW/YdeI family stress tolerance protein n=1 Tax=Emticicia aquatica TaxID=1681835 RepID=A0ABM9AT42_9BACT|nr:hypothetical protein [Emticicia aquatica]CAH0996691.1 hypothetical protein EMA8858_02825 [Emticicia aquatica]
MNKLFVSLFIFLSFNAFSQETITGSQAKDFVGKEVFLVGKVAGSRLFQRQTGDLLLLNIDKPHPENDITVVIEGETLSNSKGKFTEADLQGKVIKVKGIVSIFKDKPQIKLENAVNLTIEK